MKPIIVWLSAILAWLPTHSFATQFTRASAIRSLRRCNGEPVKATCTEEAAEFLIDQFERGDGSLLTILVRTGLYADGALATDLAVFYDEMLTTKPEVFLGQLGRYKAADRKKLAALAATGDGSGIEEEQLAKIVANLKRLIAQGRPDIQAIARIVLREVQRAN